MENLKQLLTEYGFSFNKGLGQNFLTDSNLIKSIIALSDVEKTDVALEIGCGAGALTKELSLACEKVVGYEIDARLRPVLGDALFGCDNVDIIFKDVMKESLDEIENKLGKEYILAANLPYYITTPVIMRFIENARKVKRLVVMVQAEVADRLCACENTPEYGAVTAGINFYGSARIIKRVSASMFTPRPKVDSAVVRIDVDRNKFLGADYKVYRDAVRAAFCNRRKMLVNNLMQTFKFTRETAEKIMETADISKTARGETLSAEQFVRLSQLIKNNG